MDIQIQGRVGKRMEETSGYGKISKQLGELLPHEGDPVNLWVCPPYDRKLPEGFNAILTMHETEDLPPSKATWVANLNQYNLIFVPSQWNKNNFIRFGVTKPIEVVPLGVNIDTFSTGKTPEFSTLTMHDNFGRETSRENWKETLEVYIKTFQGYKDTVLYIKTWNHREGAEQEIINEVCQNEKIHRALVPQIKIVTEVFTDEGLAAFMRSMRVFVKNANREGWSLPLNEAISCGLPCIYRNIPTLRWAHGTGAIDFDSTDQLSALLLSFYHLYYRIEKVNKKRYDISNTAKAIAKYIQQYYDTAKQTV